MPEFEKAKNISVIDNRLLLKNVFDLLFQTTSNGSARVHAYHGNDTSRSHLLLEACRRTGKRECYAESRISLNLQMI